MERVSIIIPAHNEAYDLGNLVDSIKRHLKAVEVELIIIDNGSTDQTGEVALEYQCRLIKLSEKVYPSVARNIGAKESGSEVLIFLDGDVVVTQSWAKEIERLVTDSDFMSGNVLTGDSYQMSLAPSWIENYWFEPLRKNEKSYINGGNIIITRKAFERIGGFSESLETGEDVDFSGRAKKAGVRVELNPFLVVHHEGFPKDLRNFFRRERWHGKGDFITMAEFRKSRVAQVSLVIGFFSISFVLSAPLAALGESKSATIIAVGSLLSSFGLCLTASVAKLGRRGLFSTIVGTLIFGFYFVARFASCVDVVCTPRTSLDAVDSDYLEVDSESELSRHS